MIGTLDRQTRLARVLITVPDPLAHNSDGPPLILDTLVEAHIEGRPIESVIRLDRDYVRQRDTVWVFTDGKLDIREAEVVFRDADYAYIREGLHDGDEVVTTTLATVAEGIGLRKITDLPQQGQRRLLKKGTGSTAGCTYDQVKPLLAVVPVPFFSSLQQARGEPAE